MTSGEGTPVQNGRVFVAFVLTRVHGPRLPEGYSEQAGIQTPGTWSEKILLTTESTETARSFWEQSSEVTSPAAESILESAPQWIQCSRISCVHPVCSAIAVL